MRVKAGLIGYHSLYRRPPTWAASPESGVRWVGQIGADDAMVRGLVSEDADDVIAAGLAAPAWAGY